MRRLVLVLAILLPACGSSDGRRTYAANDLILASHHAAIEACTCLFVVKQTEQFCRDYVRASPDVAPYDADLAARTVTVSTLLFWSARAHYVDDHFGCVLE